VTGPVPRATSAAEADPLADGGDLDVVVIGGGQAGLAIGYYLRRTGLGYRILDEQTGPGGAWRHTWSSLRLFSPAQWSSLPGWLMPGGVSTYPTRDDALDYLARYEERYRLPIVRPVRVTAVRRDGAAEQDRAAAGGGSDVARREEPARGYDMPLRVQAENGRIWRARAVVSTTGTWSEPYVPRIAGAADFRGRTLHSAHYHAPAELAGQRVLVVGGGNSGAQILAELSLVADTTWVTLDEPHFLPDHIDGRYLFEQATLRWKAKQEGRPLPASASLGDIVMVETVRNARDRGVLDRTVRPFTRFTETGVVWSDGTHEDIDAVIWCTGFSPALGHLDALGIREPDGRIALEGTRSVRQPRLWLVGYGDWTGYASATLIAVGRSARATGEQIEAELAAEP
jgi:putative flavoprotein involved in K+ transport